MVVPILTWLPAYAGGKFEKHIDGTDEPNGPKWANHWAPWAHLGPLGPFGTFWAIGPIGPIHIFQFGRQRTIFNLAADFKEVKTGAAM